MWRFVRFAIFVGCLGSGLHVYLYRRFVRDPLTEPRMRKVGAGVIAGLGLLIALPGPLSILFPSPWVRRAGAIGWVWMGIVGLSVSFFLVADMARLARWVVHRLRNASPKGVDPGRRVFLARALAGGVFAVSGGLGAYGVKRSFSPPEISEVQVRLKGLSAKLSGFRIVQVSDLHIGPLIQRTFVEDLVERCNRLRPDLVALTGDFVDGRIVTLAPCVAALQRLSSRSGTFFITGNHEYYSGDVAWCEAFAGLGFTVLRNRFVRIGEGKDSFDLIGTDDWIGVEGRRYDLDLATQGRDPTRPAVLLAHQPMNFEGALEKGIGLQLSGHTHGGQMFPVTALVRLAWRYPAGFFQLPGGSIYVSRGAGFWGPPMRIGSPPELVAITLLPG